MKHRALFISLSLIASTAAFFYFSTEKKPKEPEGVAIETFKKLSEKKLTLPAPTTELTQEDETAGLDVLGPLRLKTPPQQQWWHHAVIYQIWPRSFYDTNADGTGDIKGITQKLAYLKSLGITAIWLNPIFKSDSIHGYDTTDYYDIATDLGTMSEFEELIASAKAQGIKVILDLALNHVSNNHPWFIKSANKEPGYEDYFVWSEKLPEGYGKAWSDHVDSKAVWHYVASDRKWKTTKTRKDWYYGAFDSTQPDLNLKNPAVVKEIEKLTKFWIDKGVAGFRLDAIRYLVEEGGIPLQADTKSTLAFWKSYRTYIKSINPDILLIGESFSDAAVSAQYFGNGDMLDEAFDFGFGLGIGDALSATTNIATEDAEAFNLHFQRIRETLWNNLDHKYHTTAPTYFFAKALNNHDIDRINNHFTIHTSLASVAAALLLTTPGTPVIYYGDEINMPQYQSGDDKYRRAPMQWSTEKNAGFSSAPTVWVDQGMSMQAVTANNLLWKDQWNQLSATTNFTVSAQEKNDSSTLSLYKKLITIRTSDAVFKNPESVLQYNNTGSALIMKYSANNAHRWVIINLHPSIDTTLELPTEIHGDYIELISQKQLNLASQLTLKAGEKLILKNFSS